MVSLLSGFGIGPEQAENWRKMEEATQRYLQEAREREAELSQFPCYYDEAVFNGVENCPKTCPEIADSCKRRIAFQRNPIAAADLLESSRSIRELIERCS